MPQTTGTDWTNEPPRALNTTTATQDERHPCMLDKPYLFSMMPKHCGYLLRSLVMLTTTHTLYKSSVEDNTDAHVTTSANDTQMLSSQMLPHHLT